MAEELNNQVQPTESPDIIEELRRLTVPEAIPWRTRYLTTIAKCYNFKERIQWSNIDRAALDEYGVPDIAVDRINRGLDTINGVRDNTGSKKKVKKRELGDERIADVLDKVLDFVYYDSQMDEPEDLAFDALKDVGMGVQKVGWDPGKRRVWVDYVKSEDIGHGKCKRKDGEDVSFIWEHSTVDWISAAAMFPQAAGILNGLKSQSKSEWEKIKQERGTNVTSQTRDYGAPNMDVVRGWQNQVHLWEFWLKKVVPYKKVETLGEDGQPTIVKDYNIQPGVDDIAQDIEEQWWQYVLASGENFSGATIIHSGQHEYDWHPYILEVAERKKDGDPVGYIEIVLPHQIRINLAWGQKMAFNNKSLKSPLILEGSVDKATVERGMFQSKIGAIFTVPMGVKATVNQVPQLNLEAIEEGNIARQDMDFAAAVTEGPMRGQAEPGASGIKLSLQQSAAITPVNKWVKAENKAKRILYQKILEIIITKYSAEEIARIIGIEQFAQTFGIAMGPEGPQAPIQWPVPPDVAHYDVIIEDQSVSDFNKQQAFNASLAIQQLDPNGVFDMEYIIKNAPIKNVDDALLSYQKHKMDVMRMLMAQNMMLQQELEQTQKLVPAEKKIGMSQASKSRGGQNQAGNAHRGANQPQNGQQSMMGGMGPLQPTAFGG